MATALTLHEDGHRKVDPKRLAALIGSARAALPEAAHYDALDSSWAGLRPMTPNSLPIAPGVIANTGHGALGWTYAAGSARRVSNIIEGCN
jgi:D-amino-acid dehydrogenase